jgi:xylose isomerase
MLDGKMSLDEMAAISLQKNNSPKLVSGRQEGLENIVTQFVK